MKYTTPPTSVRSLEQRIRNFESTDSLVSRRRVAMALVVVSQMLPEGVVKGGSAMALRIGRNTRFTRDLDAARISSLENFRIAFEDRLTQGWAGFTGRLIIQKAPAPSGVPTAYVMQPFEVKLDFQGKSWCTVSFELGHNEIGDAQSPHFALSDDVAELFTEIGMEKPLPVAVMGVEHQIAQKLHALSSPHSERAKDLVDLQLLCRHEVIDFELLSVVCERIFIYRKQQDWPPVIVQEAQWETLYVAAIEDLDVIPQLDEAIIWANNFIQRIATVVTKRTYK